MASLYDIWNASRLNPSRTGKKSIAQKSELLPVAMMFMLATPPICGSKTESNTKWSTLEN